MMGKGSREGKWRRGAEIGGKLRLANLYSPSSSVCESTSGLKANMLYAEYNSIEIYAKT